MGGEVTRRPIKRRQGEEGGRGKVRGKGKARGGREGRVPGDRARKRSGGPEWRVSR